MKKILVTGADGFIGSHLVEQLVTAGHEVRAFCQYNSAGSWGWLDHSELLKNKDIEVVLGDIRDQTSVYQAMIGCSTVYHLAALIAIPYSYVAPKSYVDTNIHGTLNVVQSARDLSVERIIHTSTSETYGSAQFVPITEDHPLVGQSPYSASKIGADQIALSYFLSFDLPLTILRPFNTYGPRQSTRAVIPTIITQIAAGQKQIKLGSTSPTRDFNFVYDTCSAFMAVASSCKTIGKTLNAASKFEISIGDTAHLIADVMGADIEILTDDERLRPDSSEVNRLFGDNTLIKTLTSWKPEYSSIEGFRKGLEITASWFTKPTNLSHYKINQYTI